MLLTESSHLIPGSFFLLHVALQPDRGGHIMLFQADCGMRRIELTRKEDQGYGEGVGQMIENRSTTVGLKTGRGSRIAFGGLATRWLAFIFHRTVMLRTSAEIQNQSGRN